MSAPRYYVITKCLGSHVLRTTGPKDTYQDAEKLLKIARNAIDPKKVEFINIVADVCDEGQLDVFEQVNGVE